MRLKNKVAIITGSARGLGMAFALRFAKEGAKLMICDVLDCKPVAKEIKAIGGEVLALKTDVTSEKDTTEMAKKTVDRFGRIDILVNNAAIIGNIGMTNFMKPAEQITVEEWDRILSVMLRACFFAPKPLFPI